MLFEVRQEIDDCFYYHQQYDLGYRTIVNKQECANQNSKMHNHDSAVRLKHLLRQRSPEKFFFRNKICIKGNSVADYHRKIGNHYANNCFETGQFNKSEKGQKTAVN